MRSIHAKTYMSVVSINKSLPLSLSIASVGGNIQSYQEGILVLQGCLDTRWECPHGTSVMECLSTFTPVYYDSLLFLPSHSPGSKSYDPVHPLQARHASCPSHSCQSITHSLVERFDSFLKFTLSYIMFLSSLFYAWAVAPFLNCLWLKMYMKIDTSFFFIKLYVSYVC